MTCPHAKIEGSLDRWAEAHWNLHQIEQHYHFPEAFRYSFNAFVRSLKEVPQILKMDLQNEPDFASTIKPMIDHMREDPLLRKLAIHRDFVVYRGMFEMKSKGYFGTKRGRN